LTPLTDRSLDDDPEVSAFRAIAARSVGAWITMDDRADADLLMLLAPLSSGYPDFLHRNHGCRGSDLGLSIIIPNENIGCFSSV
jgi:hypothetical protein